MQPTTSKPDRLLGKPRVLISACLLGQQLRYDGGHRRQSWLVERLAALVEPVVLCPETEAGFGVPRPPMQLVVSPTTVSLGEPVRLLLVDDPSQDRTQAMRDWIGQVLPTLGHLDAAILKARSPSCGRRVGLFDLQGRSVSEAGQGLFAQALLASRPGLLLVDEEQVLDEAGQEAFLQQLGNR